MATNSLHPDKVPVVTLPNGLATLCIGGSEAVAAIIELQQMMPLTRPRSTPGESARNL